MIATTTYTESLTITTNDTGERTITRAHHAHTLTQYRFAELSEEAQQRAVSDAIAEEERNYFYSNPYASHTGQAEREIWDAARDLEQQQPVVFAVDQGCTPYATPRARNFYGDPWELVTIAEDSGMCWSMDLCDTWNAYAPRIMALAEGYDEATGYIYEHEDGRDVATYERIADACDQAAEELTEEAARAVGDMLDSLIEAERDYYQSPEFWREWLTDGDDRYTREGEKI